VLGHSPAPGGRRKNSSSFPARRGGSGDLGERTRALVPHKKRLHFTWLIEKRKDLRQQTTERRKGCRRKKEEKSSRREMPVYDARRSAAEKKEPSERPEKRKRGRRGRDNERTGSLRSRRESSSVAVKKESRSANLNRKSGKIATDRVRDGRGETPLTGASGSEQKDIFKAGKVTEGRENGAPKKKR